MSEKKDRYVRKICPCDPCNVEGIQSWLEDLAGEGLFLVKDGEFCGVFTFERRSPRKMIYRLDVAQKRKPRFLDSGDELTDEELELYRAMGWEYLLRYGDFRVYRSMVQDAPELNTESETHAITMRLLKEKHRSSFISAVLMALFWFCFAQSALRYGFRIAASVGVIFLFCVHGAILDAWVTNLWRLIRFRQYEKRLLEGGSLNCRVEWKKTAPVSLFVRTVPFLLAAGVAFGLFSGLAKEGTEIPNAEYPGEPPFATVADVFPGGIIAEDNLWLDYGTFQTGETAVAESVEWNESCQVTTEDGGKYFCILRLNYHETVSEWFARGLERDYYVYDATRYHGKRFRDMDAPDLGVDSIRVYNNYGTQTVLMREGTRVVHAVVTIEGQTETNKWHLWAETMAEMLKK